MRIHVIQTGTVAIKQVQRKGRPSGNPVLNMLLDPNWTEPMPIYAFVVEHPEGLIIDGVANDRQTARRTLERIDPFLPHRADRVLAGS